MFPSLDIVVSKSNMQHLQNHQHPIQYNNTHLSRKHLGRIGSSGPALDISNSKLKVSKKDFRSINFYFLKVNAS